jgi:hypothetical protein
MRMHLVRPTEPVRGPCGTEAVIMAIPIDGDIPE